MANKIRLKRGLKANLPTLAEGELAYCTDTKEVFKGTADGNSKVGDNSYGGIYGKCATATNVATKVVDISTINGCDSFELKEGAQITVYFTASNTANNPTLNVGGTGAKAIMTKGATKAEYGAWDAGTVVRFVYDGTNYIMDGGSIGDSSHLGRVRLSDSVQDARGANSGAAATPKAVSLIYELANNLKYNICEAYIEATDDNVDDNHNGFGTLYIGDTDICLKPNSIFIVTNNSSFTIENIQYSTSPDNEVTIQLAYDLGNNGQTEVIVLDSFTPKQAAQLHLDAEAHLTTSANGFFI